MELSKRVEELLEGYDFSLCGEIAERYNDKGRYDIELETCSPEGEDVIVSLIYDGTEESFISAFTEYASCFDAESHAEGWIEIRGRNGVPGSIKSLLEDAEWIKGRLMEVSDGLNRLAEGPLDKCMVLGQRLFGYDFFEGDKGIVLASCIDGAFGKVKDAYGPEYCICHKLDVKEAEKMDTDVFCTESSWS